MPSKPAVPFETACSLVHEALAGPARDEIAAALADAPSLGTALFRLRECLRTHSFHVAGHRLSLARVVNGYDQLTRAEGFHVLHDWDGKADRVVGDSIPIDVLNYVARVRGEAAAAPALVEILLDYYFMHVLALLTLRIWDEGDADENLARVNALLGLLQSEHGSGQLFTADAETLMLVGTSHFELQEVGYDRLLDRVRGLDRVHQTNIALGHASSMGCHLRFGFEATYGRDTLVMRDDNLADYPWLCYALATVMREYSRLRDAGIDGVERARVVEAILNGLSGDARAFVGVAPSCLSRCEFDRAEFAERFHGHEQDLLDEFERFRPSEQRYSPLSFFFNFSHNILKGTIIDTLLREELWPLSFNDLLTSAAADEGASRMKEMLANTLMTYARLNPDRIRGRLMPVIVYDPGAGRQAFGTTMRRIRE
jgi:hypothetical protein